MNRTGAFSLLPLLWALACNQAGISSKAQAPSANPSLGGPSAPPVTLPDAAPTGRDPGTGPGTAAPGGACQPVTCKPAGGSYCGTIGDGCGGRLDCGGSCPAGQTCGGGGGKNVCGAPVDPNCQPLSCQQGGARLCGRVGDGCGRAQDCPSCPAGQTCGATLANVCGDGSAAAAACDNLCKQQVACPAGQETVVTGTVIAPTPERFGPADPLYNALVYVPNRPLQPFAAGAACDLCGAPVSGAPLVSTLSGADGTFTLRNVPAGDAIPLVIQIGRWRRQITIPKVTACTSTPLPKELTRLPRNQSEGSIPQMAIATGTYDPFECVLRKVGVDEAEFTPPGGPGRVHIYKFGGFNLGQPVPPGANLVGSADVLAKYDMVLLPCDDKEAKPAAAQGNLRDYVARGGRLFLTDWSHSWLRDGGAFEATASWLPTPLHIARDFETAVDQSFPKGMAFAQWLQIVGASTRPGRLPIHDPYYGESYFEQVRTPTQRWLYTDIPGKATVQHFTFNAPIGAPPAQQCGRVVFSTFHVAGERAMPVIDPALPRGTFPTDCSNAPMTPQEKALEFMLFDASACVLPDNVKPTVFQPPPLAPPPPPPQIE